MDRRSLLIVLNRFLALECQQVALYRGQGKRVGDEHLRRALELFADIEIGHVKNLRREIKRLGGKYSPLVEMADGLGAIMGRASRLPGIAPMLKLNILIEGRAARDYAGLIRNLPPGPTRDLLWKHRLEEELHRAWMLEYLRRERRR